MKVYNYKRFPCSTHVLFSSLSRSSVGVSWTDNVASSFFVRVKCYHNEQTVVMQSVHNTSRVVWSGLIIFESTRCSMNLIPSHLTSSRLLSKGVIIPQTALALWGSGVCLRLVVLSRVCRILCRPFCMLFTHFGDFGAISSRRGAVRRHFGV